MRRPLLALLLALSACSKCDEKTPPEPVTGAPVVAAPPEKWVKGELPAEAFDGTPTAGGTLTVRVMSEPPGLYWLHDSFRDLTATRITNLHVYESLLEIDRETYKLKPLLAERYEVSADNLTHTFALRKGVKFHNGDAFTA